MSQDSRVLAVLGDNLCLVLSTVFPSFGFHNRCMYVLFIQTSTHTKKIKERKERGKIIFNNFLKLS